MGRTLAKTAMTDVFRPASPLLAVVMLGFVGASDRRCQLCAARPQYVEACD
ncbi:hypothetical protein [Cypionkella sp. TWP1-2-1b2]|uniref:hypothetical protein n=1 Tax=Cypionkella sp. TWP1-2-1b2 TaxID=2804675 RepID=UPI003CE9A3C3